MSRKGALASLPYGALTSLPHGSAGAATNFSAMRCIIPMSGSLRAALSGSPHGGTFYAVNHARFPADSLLLLFSRHLQRPLSALGAELFPAMPRHPCASFLRQTQPSCTLHLGNIQTRCIPFPAQCYYPVPAGFPLEGFPLSRHRYHYHLVSRRYIPAHLCTEISPADVSVLMAVRLVTTNPRIRLLRRNSQCELPQYNAQKTPLSHMHILCRDILLDEHILSCRRAKFDHYH